MLDLFLSADVPERLTVGLVEQVSAACLVLVTTYRMPELIWLTAH